MIRYDRLWVTMEACGMTQYRLIKRHNFSAGQIGRLKKNMHVSTHTLDTLCTILGCGICDIIEYVPESGPEDAPDSGMPLASCPPPPTRRNCSGRFRLNGRPQFIGRLQPNGHLQPNGGLRFYGRLQLNSQPVPGR